MRCPRCVQKVHSDCQACPHCGFIIRAVDTLFAPARPELPKFCDAAGVIRARERPRLRRALDHFEDTFPTCFFAVYLDANPQLESIRQFSFWLLNRAHFTDLEAEQSRHHGVLLVCDVHHKQATIAYGYGLADHLSEAATFKLLASTHPDFLQNDYPRALHRIIHGLTHRLRRSARRAQLPDTPLEESPPSPTDSLPA